jgi:hypothetical protein
MELKRVDGWTTEVSFDYGRELWHRSLQWSNKRQRGHSVYGKTAYVTHYSNGSSWSWHKLVENYTRRELSKPADRALAISGIATAAQCRTINGYVAGHFLYADPDDLLWTIEYPAADRPLVYQGPTWSWTGVNGPVSFRCVSGLTNVIQRPSLEEGSYVQRCDWNIAAVETRLVDDQAPFGAVRSSILSLHARVQLLQVKSIHGSKTGPGQLTIIFQNRDVLHEGSWDEHVPIRYSISFIPDALQLANDLDETQPARLLLVLLGWHWYPSNPVGLVLIQSGNVGGTNGIRYKRCGVFVAVQAKSTVKKALPSFVSESMEERVLNPFYDGFRLQTIEIE